MPEGAGSSGMLFPRSGERKRALLARLAATATAAAPPPAALPAALPFGGVTERVCPAAAVNFTRDLRQKSFSLPIGLPFCLGLKLTSFRCSPHQDINTTDPTAATSTRSLSKKSWNPSLKSNLQPPPGLSQGRVCVVTRGSSVRTIRTGGV